MSCFKESLEDWRYFLLGVLFYEREVGIRPATGKNIGSAQVESFQAVLSVELELVPTVIRCRKRGAFQHGGKRLGSLAQGVCVS